MPYAVVLSEIPSSINAGESLSWKWSHGTFPAPSWTLVYTLVSAAAQIQITASASGSEHLVEITSTVSAAYDAGEYAWQAHVSKGAEKYKVGEGLVTIGEDLAAFSNGHDTRSHVKKVLDALEASIEKRASKTQLKQSIDGIAIEHMSLSQQIELRDRYAVKYRKELARKNGRSDSRTTVARFVN